MDIVLFAMILFVIYLLKYNFNTGDLSCGELDLSCKAWTNKDILSKCDSFCKNNLGDSFSHTQKYNIQSNGNIDCECKLTQVNDLNFIGTPSTNVKPVSRDQLPSRVGEIERLTKYK
jgi:hypothetical protein